MIFFITLLIVSFVVTMVFFFVLKTISITKLLLIVGSQLVVAIASSCISYYSSTLDEQVINSFVVDKKKVRVSCSHSYRCHCHNECSGSGDKRSCHEECDTCYDHSNDWDWDVYNAMNETITIDRIDRQGANEPKRWTDIVIGDPTAITHNYENFVKAAPGTLFKNEGSIEGITLPPYPLAIYDYYRLDRLVQIGVSLSDARRWNNELSELNSQLGEKKQVNIIVVVTKDRPSSYFYALRQAWVGGKKNDVILVVNVDVDLHPVWAEVMSWELNMIFNVKLRDAVMAQETLNSENVVSALRMTIMDFHKRKPMADFAYLKSSIVPSTMAWVVSFIIQLVITLGLLFYFNTTGDRNHYGYR